ncbi:hypothetical protein AVEN_50025-1 [Araneus ventricosus]|uniref:Uncharacterized protein n=1 Tax=Araneus ventricosus TaxID=182803 RepID=A0A4Y2D2X3_ARAVE|nr:hypothetical protein AVEN_50025-1 [Araneus ventricosus]
MTRTIPELAPLSPNFRSTPAIGLTTDDLTCIRPTYTADLLMESGFEPVTLRLPSQDLTTRLPRPSTYVLCSCKSVHLQIRNVLRKVDFLSHLLKMNLKK